MTRALVPLVSFLLAAVALHADEPVSVNTLFTAGEMRAVRQGAILTRASLSGSEPVNLAPPDDRITVPATRYTDPALAGYEMIADERAFIPCRPDAKLRLALYNKLFSHSLFSGMKYYSHTEKKAETLVLESCTIDTPRRCRRLRSTAVKKIEPHRSGAFFMRDNRLGAIIFRTDLYAEGENFITTSVSEIPVTRFGLEVSEKGDYRMASFLIYDRDAGGFYYYSLHALRIRSGIILRSGMLSPKSFANRVRANTVHTAKLLGVNWQDRLAAAR